MRGSSCPKTEPLLETWSAIKSFRSPLSDDFSLPFGSKSVDNIRSIPNLRSLLEGGGACWELNAVLETEVSCSPCLWYGDAGFSLAPYTDGSGATGEGRSGDVPECPCCVRWWWCPICIISADDPEMFSASPACKMSAMQNEGFFIVSTAKPPAQYADHRLKFDA